MVPIHIGHKVQVEMGFVMCQGFGDHDRTQIRSTNADVNDVGKGLSTAACNGPVNHALAKAFDLIDNRMNTRDDIFTIHTNVLIPRGTKGSVQHRSPFRSVDQRPTKVMTHRFVELAFFCELSQQGKGLLRQVVFRKIDIKVIPANAKLLPAFGIPIKKVLQPLTLRFFIVFLKFAPSCCFRWIDCW